MMLSQKERKTNEYNTSILVSKSSFRYLKVKNLFKDSFDVLINILFTKHRGVRILKIIALTNLM